jgi:lysophospholipase L1-like esterase
MVMKNVVKPGVKVHNHAQGGASSKSFMTGRKWENVLKQAKKGDFVIIQFGHNDAVLGEKNLYRMTNAEKTYPIYLKIYINEAKLRGLHPVLVTQTVYIGFKADGTVYNYKQPNEVGGAAYVAACKKLAAELGCDFVDLNAAALERFAGKSQQDVEKFYMVLAPGESPNYPKGRSDRVHLNQNGAAFYASLFAELAKAQNLPIAGLLK